MEANLVEAFLAILSAEDRAAAPAELGAQLVALCTAARAANRELAVDEAVLTGVIARHARGDVAGYLGRCRSGELWLASRCAAGDSTAIAALRATFDPIIERVVRRFASTEHAPDDLRQIIMARLLVGDGERRPKIADYAGQGFLENWLRVTAVRICLDLAKRKDRAREKPVVGDAELALPSPADLSLEHLKAEYRPVVAAALHAAARALSPGDRVLLRQHLAAGMTIDQLGAVLGVHRATAARRIERARASLLESVRTALAARLALDLEEVDSVIGLVASRLDLSAERLFATASTS